MMARCLRYAGYRRGDVIDDAICFMLYYDATPLFSLMLPLHISTILIGFADIDMPPFAAYSRALMPSMRAATEVLSAIDAYDARYAYAECFTIICATRGAPEL